MKKSSVEKTIPANSLKLSILVMGANVDICDGFTFRDEFELAKQTWIKDLPENVNVIYYNGGNYMETVMEEDPENPKVSYLHLACEDEMLYTFKKTWMAYKWVYENMNPDWIFRTNTSTYVNSDVLYDFVENHAENKVTYGSDLYSLSEACCPWPLCLYPRGNGVLTHRDVYHPCIIQNGIQLAYQKICDDICFGILINSYNINTNCENTSYTRYMKGLPHAWYKCVDQKFDNGHVFSKYGDDDLNYHDFVTITVKKYREREKEKEHYLELYKKIESDQIVKKADPKWTNEMLSYVDKPSVFCGSIIGYFNFDYWNTVDKNELFLLEISMKATDDAEHYVYKEIQGKKLSNLI